MKSVLLFCILALANAYDFLDYRKLVSVFDHLASNSYVKSLERVKRAIITKPLDDPNNCVSTCAVQLNTHLTDLHFNATTSTANASEGTRLQLLCQAFGPASACFHTCPTSQLGNLVLDFLPIMSMICNLGDENYPEVLISLACINATKPIIDEVCNAACDKYYHFHIIDAMLAGNFRDKPPQQQPRRNSTIQINLLPNFVVYDDNKTRNTENFKIVCSFVTCVDDCDDPIIKDACGAQAVQVQNKLVTNLVRAIKSLFKDLNAVDNDPEECKRYDKS